MKVIVVGLGVQGYKRRLHAGEDFFAAVDPVNKDAEYKNIKDVPLHEYDAVLACIPDKPKYDIIKFCLENKKHILVEKPLWVEDRSNIKYLEELAIANKVLCYTAYNHRFEPHFVKMKELIASSELGEIYSCRMFYGNGTARLVKDSVWRDKGAGVLPDLGSHLLDTCRFWFGNALVDFHLNAVHRFENLSPDHVVISSEKNHPRIELEMTLCMWRNHFTCDILAEKGTAHIESLCKWGPSTFTHRKRVIPSGRPEEKQITLIEPDPTWAIEYQNFKKMVELSTVTDLSEDIWLNDQLSRLSNLALK